ncbi:MAG: malto-oligosyltrehalose synthase [Chthoniobacterales bacterium]
MTENPRIPTATYRLQFNRQFTFADARAITPYLHALGISDAYASPYFQARAESLHGYDITDHNKLNPAIGSREEYDAWVAELHARQMGQVLDFVPNHMGIGEALNTWWQDVLENGPSSAFADFFDIDWHPIKSELHDKVLIPTLGDQYGRVLERGELKVRYDAGTFYLCYYQHEFPIAPGTYRFILDRALEILEPDKEKDYYAELQSIRTALEYLPKRTEIDPERIAERGREKEIIKRRLDRRCQEAPQVLRAIEQALEQINGIPGEPRSFDALDELLNAQAYRLSFWRVAAEEINYRRFFDVNDLAAIRMELPEVFDATHTLLLELVAARAVTGIRIDHPDGLYLPGEYFRKLQHRCAEALGIELPKDGRAVYMIVEKILTGRERLPKEWPVHGTTGYDFATLLTQLLVDGSSEQAITKTYRRFIGHSMHFGHLAYAKKRLITRLSLANDVAVLGSMLDRLSETNRWFRDFTLQQLQIAVRETIACFPVYRTYVGPGEPVREEDRAVIERAISTAKRRNPGIEESVFNYLRDILQLKFPENFDEEARAAHTHFVLKFQQATGPITAKGIEDTTFYVYNRLAALNEVGGEPQQFGCSIDDFHQENAERLANWPATLLATSTHDTKRSEDVRARMVAISELSDAWRTSVLRWRTLNRRAKKTVDDAEAPDANEEYLFYQTLLGTWPVDSSGKPEQTASPEFIQRIQEYMGKALKEAKINTSWVQPREPWDNAMRDFIATTLEASPRNRFLPALFPLAEEIAQLGAINSLSQLVLKLTVPGVPDVYQGNELWDFSLVDPDNRRPVDYSHRQQMLASLGNTQPHELLEHWPDGRIKLLATTRLLTFRREHADLFKCGTYTPLQTLGTFADSCIAFAREREGESLLVIVPRLTARVGFPPVAEKWQDTAVQLPNSLTAARELFTGRELTHDNGQLALAEALRVLPFAAYVAKA